MIVVYHKIFIVAKGLEAILRHRFIGQKIVLFSDFEEVTNNDESADVIICDNETFTEISKNQSFRSKIIVVDEQNTTDYENFIPLNSDANDFKDAFDKILGEKQRDEEDALSEREKEIVKLVAQGLTNKEIADKLFLSVHTVITHRKNISNKLGIRTISGLTTYAILNGIIELDELKN